VAIRPPSSRISAVLAALLLAACGASTSVSPIAQPVVHTAPGGSGPPAPTGHWTPSWSPGPHHHRHHTPAPPPPPPPHHHHHRPPDVPAVDVPRVWLTPGVAMHVGVARICTSGYASSVRDVPESEKASVYARYGVTWVPYQHEVDHLISLELGGSNAIANLWPEPYAGRWGARTKDVLENRMHDLVCAGQLSLTAAQHQEATDWVAAYRRYVGTPPGGGSGGSGGSDSGGGGTSPGGYYASSYPSASTIYCADDPEWRSLSTTYLVHFATWSQAIARFPSYHLHQPC
jgi:hypothetical protein